MKKTTNVPRMPDDFRGAEKGRCGYTDSAPREWTEKEVSWMMDMISQGYSRSEIAESMGRTPVSIQIKLKRLGKKNERYNESHRLDKYNANISFFETYKPATILDAYCGTESFWKNQTSVSVTTNDINKDIEADYHKSADKLVAQFYAEDRTFDMIDLDPFGSAYDCFDLSLRMAKKCIIVTFGEMGHKRWKRLDYVRSHYGIESMSDFTTSVLIERFKEIGRKYKKECIPVIVKEWPRVSRVYFELKPIKITEQWEKEVK